MTTPKLQMPELVVGQAGKELTHNQALAVLDQLAQAVVVDKDLAAPPGSPANGSMYIVAAGATDAWAGQSGKLAYWLTTVAAWTFITPADGWSAWVTDEAVRYERKAGTWVVVATVGGASFAPVVTESTTARTLTLTDAGAYLRHTNASASTVTVAPQASVAWAADTEIHIRRAAAGNLTLTPGSGVTLNAPSGGTLVMTSAMSVTLKRAASDTWDVIGQTVPA